MDQEKFIEGMWKWMVDDGLVDPTLKEEFLPFLNMIWVGGFDNGRSRRSHGRGVVKMDQFGNEVARYKTAIEAGRKNGVTAEMISRVCLGKNSTAGLRKAGEGFYYRYIDDEKKV